MKRAAVVVTGTSTGIGASMAVHLVEKGFHVFGSVRRTEDGDRLRKRLGDAFTPLHFDVTDRDAIERAAAEVDTALDGATLAGLVNNAAMATGGPLAHVPLDDFRQLLEVNLIGVIAVTQEFYRSWGATAHGRAGPGESSISVPSVASARCPLWRPKAPPSTPWKRSRRASGASCYCSASI